MDSHKIILAIVSGDDSWAVTWQGATGADPHDAVKMARELVSIASTAAVGQWPAQAVADTVARIGREFPALPAPAFETPESRAAADRAARDAARKAEREAGEAARKLADEQAAIEKAEAQKVEDERVAAEAAAKKTADDETAKAAEALAAQAAAESERKTKSESKGDDDGK